MFALIDLVRCDQEGNHVLCLIGIQLIPLDESNFILSTDSLFVIAENV